MSNITFMIGNGFDCACGLKSRFIDTYDGYVKSFSQSESIEHFKKTILKDISTWADFEMQLADYSKECDSEGELLECIRDYDAYLNDYLLAEQQRFWSENEHLLSEPNVVLREIGISLSKFYEGLTNNDIEALSSAIQRNGRITYSFINFNYTNIFDRLVEQAFQYNEVDKHFDRACSRHGVIHIHGVLGEDVTLGIDNDGQLPGLPYSLSSRGKRSLIKPTFLRAFDKSRIEKTIKTISESEIVCVFGMSLGDSDVMWRNTLATWLESSNSHHLVFFKHSYMMREYHSTAKTKKMDDEEDGKEEVLALLFETELSEDVKEELTNRIHVPVGMSIFNIRDAIIETNQLKQSKEELKKKLSSAVSYND